MKQTSKADLWQSGGMLLIAVTKPKKLGDNWA